MCDLQAFRDGLEDEFNDISPSTGEFDTGSDAESGSMVSCAGGGRGE